MKCELCKREVSNIEFHHFFPGKKRRKSNDGIFVCLTCGDQIHLLFSNTELRNDLNSLEKLLDNEKMKTYLSWIKNKPEKTFSMSKKKKR